MNDKNILFEKYILKIYGNYEFNLNQQEIFNVQAEMLKKLHFLLKNNIIISIKEENIIDFCSKIDDGYSKLINTGRSFNCIIAEKNYIDIYLKC